MTTTLFTHALLLPCDGRTAFVEDAWVLVRDGLVAGLGSGVPPAEAVRAAERTVDVAGAFLAPGFVSSHSHLFTSGSRGLGADETLYGWCTAMYAVVRDASPEDIYWCILHGALDHLGAGVTTAFDFADSLLPWTPIVEGRRLEQPRLRPIDYSLRQVDAKVDAGLRFVHAIHLDDAVGGEQDIADRFATILAHVRSQGSPLALDGAVMGSVQWSETPRTAEREAILMALHGVRNQAHFLETAEHLELQRSKFAWYDDAGALGPGLVFGHFVHPTAAMIDRVAETGTAVSWQATANGRLGSGIAPVTDLRAAGVRLGLGLDDEACTDLADPWQNMRIGLYTQRAHQRSALAMRAADVLHCATLGAAEVIGAADKVGSIEVGKLADLIVVDPRRPDLGPVWNPVETYVLACSPRNLRQVWVGGELVVDEGVSTHPLAAEVSAQVHARLRAINP